MGLRDTYFKHLRKLLFVARVLQYHLLDTSVFEGKGRKPWCYLHLNYAEQAFLHPEYWDNQWKHWGESKKRGKRYYKDVKKFLNEHSKNVFEIGCGPGYLVESLSPSIHYTGIDFSEEAIMMARRKAPFDFFVARIEDMGSYLLRSERKFDTLVAIDVLEHLTDEQLKIVIYHAMSYDFTYLCIVTPYDRWVPAPGHIQCFNKSRMKDLFGSAYFLKFKPYSKYREFLTLGIRKTKGT